MNPRSDLPKPHLNSAPDQTQHIPGLSDAEISGQDPNTPQPPTVQPDIQQFAQKVNGRQILIFAIAGMSILAVTLIALVIILLVVQNNRKDAPSTVTGNETTDSTKKVVKSVKLNNPDLELLIYEPVQKGSNTTIDFALRNKCAADCDEPVHASAYDLLGYTTSNPKNLYLLDDDVGKKYAPLTDEDGKALGTETCTDFLKPNESIECFVSFSKVPSGKTVSLVLGANAPRIDGIQIP